MNEICQYVASSSVRVDIVEILSEQQTPTSQLIERLDASTSAVYSALSELEERTIVRESDAGWKLTGYGEIITDTVVHQQAIEAFLAHDPDYWQNRRTDALPERFRRRLPEIGAYEIVRADIPEVGKRDRELATRLGAADTCRVISRVYKLEYERLLSGREAQLILTPRLIDRLIERVRAGTRDRIVLEQDIQIRVMSVSFGLGTTPESLWLVIPPETNDRAMAMLVSETDTAIQWANDLFEHLWADAQPLVDYLDERGVDTTYTQ